MGDDLDPFGRKKDDDPLASLGWQADETASTTEPEPKPAAPTREHEPRLGADEPAMAAGTWRPQPEAERRGSEPTSAPPPPRRAGQGSLVARFARGVLALAIVVAVLGGALLAMVNSGKERVHDIVRELPDSFPEFRPPPGSGSPFEERSGRAQPALPARGLSVDSLLRPAAFGRALARLRSGGYGRLTNLRVAPDRIDATMVTRGGRLRLLQIVPGGAVRVLQTTTGRFAGTRAMTLEGIDPRAPNRLTRSAAGRLGQPASRVDYLVLMDFAGARQWNVYFKGGQIFSADAHGRITRRIS